MIRSAPPPASPSRVGPGYVTAGVQRHFFLARPAGYQGPALHPYYGAHMTTEAGGGHLRRCIATARRLSRWVSGVECSWYLTVIPRCIRVRHPPLDCMDTRTWCSRAGDMGLLRYPDQHKYVCNKPVYCPSDVVYPSYLSPNSLSLPAFASCHCRDSLCRVGNARDQFEGRVRSRGAGRCGHWNE